jgi:hypothetical protein
VSAAVLASVILTAAAVIAHDPPFGTMFLVAAVVAWLATGLGYLSLRRAGR